MRSLSEVLKETLIEPDFEGPWLHRLRKTPASGEFG